MLDCGIITVVQEHRFLLRGDDGTHRHFTLAHNAPLGWNELKQLEREGCRVAVRHEQPLPRSTTASVQAVWRLRAGEIPAGVRSSVRGNDEATKGQIA